MHSDRDRVDLVVDHPELLLFVEIKVNAVEGVEQLRRYAEAAQDMARCAGRPAWRVAYLTRTKPRTLESDIIPLIWRDLVAYLAITIGRHDPGFSRPDHDQATA